MQAAANINNAFFEGSYQEAWRHMMPQGLTLAEADFIMEMARLQSGSRVLDLMCGYGRHAFELAHRGAIVTAVDNLTGYVEEINEKASAAGLPVTALQQDVATLSVDGHYNAVICMGNSFNFFEREAAISIMNRIAGLLGDDGVFVVSTWSIAEIAIRHFKERDWQTAGDYQCGLDSKFLTQPNRIETEQTIIGPDGSIERRKGVDYIFSLNEWETMALEAGLRIKHIYATPRKKTFRIGDVAIYLVFEKNQ